MASKKWREGGAETWCQRIQARYNEIGSFLVKTEYDMRSGWSKVVVTAYTLGPGGCTRAASFVADSSLALLPWVRSENTRPSTKEYHDDGDGDD
jgi:hypothetical protein